MHQYIQRQEHDLTSCSFPFSLLISFASFLLVKGGSQTPFREREGWSRSLFCFHRVLLSYTETTNTHSVYYATMTDLLSLSWKQPCSVAFWNFVRDRRPCMPIISIFRGATQKDLGWQARKDWDAHLILFLNLFLKTLTLRYSPVSRFFKRSNPRICAKMNSSSCCPVRSCGKSMLVLLAIKQRSDSLEHFKSLPYF